MPVPFQILVTLPGQGQELVDASQLDLASPDDRRAAIMMTTRVMATMAGEAEPSSEMPIMMEEEFTDPPGTCKLYGFETDFDRPDGMGFVFAGILDVIPAGNWEVTLTKRK